MRTPVQNSTLTSDSDDRSIIVVRRSRHSEHFATDADVPDRAAHTFSI